MTPAIDHVALTVRDLPAMTAFYRDALGLNPLGGDGETARLGAGGRTLLELRGDLAARTRDPRQAGLFHTAFLLPERADLARWLRHAAETRLHLTGASDHGVSEAIYLDDPEGNGIEIYWDRPPSEWQRDGDRIRMVTLRLDPDGLLALADRPWSGAPDGSRIGHVHLQVGDLDRAEDFFAGDLGLTRTFDGPGGAWYGWNGYHHHLAGNVWNSRGAGPRDRGTTGLAEIAIRDPARAGRTIADPWGTPFRFL
ncbi:VOC family protein [Paracoccus sp. S3-43]|uniref:VOC family protein n=1 Tax=Paracoccus sp. S3-43 TaxID=3030011 RepID=UPI0023AEE06E|nr:VOC family protein [Paracoccus sp. S3-43]WEF24913.1 VOC family protein [Paracoccus sp. S3-43]